MVLSAGYCSISSFFSSFSMLVGAFAMFAPICIPIPVVIIVNNISASIIVSFL